MGSGAQVDRDLPGGVVPQRCGGCGGGSNIYFLVVMIEKSANFRFRFDVSVFGDSQVRTDSRWIQVFQFEARVQERFMGAKIPMPRPECLRGPLFASYLVFSNSQTPDGKSPMLRTGKELTPLWPAASALQKVFKSFSERVIGQTYPGNDNAFMIHWV